VGDVPSDSIAAGSFDWWSGCGNDIFQNRYRTWDSFEMRKINPRSRIRAEMRSIMLNKMWLPCGDAYNWYSGLECCIGSGFDLGFTCRSQHWHNQSRQLLQDWLSELNLGLPYPMRLASIHCTADRQATGVDIPGSTHKYSCDSRPTGLDTHWPQQDRQLCHRT
jgi:hypothetical protein